MNIILEYFFLLKFSQIALNNLPTKLTWSWQLLKEEGTEFFKKEISSDPIFFR